MPQDTILDGLVFCEKLNEEREYMCDKELLHHHQQQPQHNGNLQTQPQGNRNNENTCSYSGSGSSQPRMSNHDLMFQSSSRVTGTGTGVIPPLPQDTLSLPPPQQLPQPQQHHQHHQQHQQQHNGKLPTQPQWNSSSIMEIYHYLIL